MFKPDLCNECGTCLTQCQYLTVSSDEACAQIRDLKAGLCAEVLDQCITCMACNEYCPEGANPYDLILAAQEAHGVCMIPPEAVDTIERTLAGQPRSIVPGEPGLPALCLCTMQQACPPDMLESSLLAGMPVVSGGDFFSRAVYLHTGMESVVRDHAPRYIANLADLGHDEIVFLHDDCYVLAAHKAPEYGIRVPDALQIATALESRATAFVTNDRRLKKVKDLDVIVLKDYLN